MSVHGLSTTAPLQWKDHIPLPFGKTPIFKLHTPYLLSTSTLNTPTLLDLKHAAFSSPRLSPGQMFLLLSAWSVFFRSHPPPEITCLTFRRSRPASNAPNTQTLAFDSPWLTLGPCKRQGSTATSNSRNLEKRKPCRRRSRLQMRGMCQPVERQLL